MDAAAATRWPAPQVPSTQLTDYVDLLTEVTRRRERVAAIKDAGPPTHRPRLSHRNE